MTSRATSGSTIRAARPASPQRQAAITKERLVMAFAVAFAEHGYLAVNLNDVLGDLGLTKGAFYFHFRSKADVAREIVGRQRELWASTRDAAIRAEGDTLQTLVDTTQRLCRSYQTDPIARAGTRLSAERAVIETELPRPYVAWTETFTALLRIGQRRGDVAEGVDPAAYANFLVAFLVGAFQVSGELSRRQDLAGRLEVLWKVLLPALRPGAGAVVACSTTG